LGPLCTFDCNECAKKFKSNFHLAAKQMAKIIGLFFAPHYTVTERRLSRCSRRYSGADVGNICLKPGVDVEVNKPNVVT